MLPTALELPLDFAGHDAKVIATPLHAGGWHVRAEVDGRTLGWERYTWWAQVEHFHRRMQQWISQAAVNPQRTNCAA